MEHNCKVLFFSITQTIIDYIAVIDNVTVFDFQSDTKYQLLLFEPQQEISELTHKSYKY